MAVDQDDVKNNKEKGQLPLGLLCSGMFGAVGSRSSNQPANHTYLHILNRRCLAKQKKVLFMLFIHSCGYFSGSSCGSFLTSDTRGPLYSPLYLTPCKQ